MVTDLEQLTQAALLLSSEAKVALVERLLQSLDVDELSELDEAWIEEAEKRYEELHSGKTVGIPAHEVFAQIREELRCKS
jgi:putative addiction module component (TIGR02574 family)